MNNIISIALDSSQPNQTIYNDPITYKGSTDVEFDLSKISEKKSSALNITIDWGDSEIREYYSKAVAATASEQSIFREVTEGLLGGSILNKYKHIYAPTETHINELSAQVLINFDDGNYTLIVQPLILVQESYYDNIKEFLISSLSVHDESYGSVINLQSKYTEQTWPVVIGSNILKPPELSEDVIFPYDIEFGETIAGGGGTGGGGTGSGIDDTGSTIPPVSLPYDITNTIPYDISNVPQSAFIDPLGLNL